MTNLAKLIDEQTTELSTATVSRVDGSGLTVEEGDLTYPARKAATCLIEPEPGDEVLLLHDGGRAFVLAILERGNQTVPRVDFEDGVDLGSSKGDVSIGSRGSLDLRAGRRIGLAAPVLDLSAAVGRLVTGRLELTGRVANATWERIRVRASKSESLVDEVIGRFRSRFSKVERLDNTEAGVLRQKSEDAHIQETKYSFMRAEKDMKIKAKQIMMG